MMLVKMVPMEGVLTNLETLGILSKIWNSYLIQNNMHRLPEREDSGGKWLRLSNADVR